MSQCDKHGRSAQLLLCLASDADGSTFRLCGNQDEAMAFYKEMWGEDLGGGIQSQIDHFSDEDNWSHGMTEYSCDLYCSTFRVWRVDRDEVSLPSCAAATSTPSSTRPIKITQTVMGKYGNCQSACLAMMLGVPLESVPNFAQLAQDTGDNEAYAAQGGWLRERGWGILTVVKWQALPWPPRHGYFIAGGPSPRGHRHAVIYKDGELWHDPHPEGGGISEVQDIDFLYPLNPVAPVSAIAPLDAEWCMDAFWRVNPGRNATVPSLYLLDFAREVLRVHGAVPSTTEDTIGLRKRATAAEDVLIALVVLKMSKDKNGKTASYEQQQPRAWEDAKRLLRVVRAAEFGGIEQMFRTSDDRAEKK